MGTSSAIIVSFLRISAIVLIVFVQVACSCEGSWDNTIKKCTYDENVPFNITSSVRNDTEIFVIKNQPGYVEVNLKVLENQTANLIAIRLFDNKNASINLSCTECKLTELILNFNNILHLVFPPTESSNQLKRLIKLHYKENEFSQLTIPENSSIPMEDFLQQTKLTQFPFETLKHFTNTLKSLKLNENDIEKIDHDFLASCKVLDDFRIMLNRINEWPQTDNVQNSIKTLTLNWNDFSTLNLTYLSLFVNLEYLSINSRNSFDGLIGSLNLTNLKQLYITNQEFNVDVNLKKLLKHTSQLNLLSLNKFLTYMPTLNAMSLIPKLTQLYLGSNSITVLDLNVFQMTPNIEVISVYSNQLQRFVPPKTGDFLTKLRTLNLNDNQLIGFPDFCDQLTGQLQLLVTKNLFVCDVRLKWLKTCELITNREAVECLIPGDLSNTAVLLASVNDSALLNYWCSDMNGSNAAKTSGFWFIDKQMISVSNEENPICVTTTTDSYSRCARSCFVTSSCQSFDYFEGNRTCLLYKECGGHYCKI